MLPEENWGTRAEEINNVHVGFIVDKTVVLVIYFCDFTTFHTPRVFSLNTVICYFS